MTNEEVIKILKNEYLCRINIKDGCYPWKCKNCEYSEDKDDVTQAINYAVQALSKQSASSEQADTKLFNRGYWLMPGEVFISHNVLNEVLDTIIKSMNTEQRKIDSILAKTAENDEAPPDSDQIADGSKMVDQFRDSTKKTEDVPDIHVGKTDFKPGGNPGIIHCKDCKKFVKDHFNIPYCYRDPGCKWNENDYCSKAERRNDDSD